MRAISGEAVRNLPLPRKRELARRLEPLYFIAPSLIFLFGVLGIPVATAVVNSFVPLWSETRTFTLENYHRLVRDDLFWNALRVSLTFVGTTVFMHLVVGFGLALVLNLDFPLRPIFRVLAILPWTVPDVISGLVWRFMYNPTSGIINYLLMRAGLTKAYIDWLGDPDLALWSVILSDVWRGYPFVMLILLAGLQSIPQDLYEAARVDGATFWQELRYVVIPMLSRVFVVAAALDTIWQFRRFGLVYNMTLGGPGHVTEIMSLYIYKQYFRYFNFEYASALAVVMALIMLVISLPYVRMMVREM